MSTIITLVITAFLGGFFALIAGTWFFKIHPLAGILGGIVVFLMISGSTFLKWFRWRQLPTLEDYKSQNPSAKAKHGIQCIHCGGNSIRNWGVWNANDAKRSHICETCSTSLYRTYGRRQGIFDESMGAIGQCWKLRQRDGSFKSSQIGLYSSLGYISLFGLFKVSILPPKLFIPRRGIFTIRRHLRHRRVRRFIGKDAGAGKAT